MSAPNSHRLDDLDRRRLVAGLGAGAACGFPPAPAQDGRPREAGFDDRQIPLLPNLFTRVGAAVSLNGQGPFTFVIDTGAGTTSVADIIAEQLALPPLASIRVHGITAAAVARGVAVDRLLLNGLGFRNLHCPVFGRGQLGADGLIGLDVLGRFRLTFDVMHRSANLNLRGVSLVMGSEAGIVSRIRRDGLRTVRGRFGQMILTQVQADGQPIAAFIDSGAQYSIGNLALRRAVAARRTDNRRPARAVPVYGVTGQTLVAEPAWVNDLRLGPSRMGPTPLLFADLHCFEILELAGRPALLIGADLLGRFREVSLDFPANTVTFTGLRRQSTRVLRALEG
jgi:hypothetical protein